MELPSFQFLVCILFNALILGTSRQNHRTVPSGVCHLVNFDVHESAPHDHALEGHVFKRSTVHGDTHCHVMCGDDCRCISMNYVHTKQNDNCELNDVTKEMKPTALKYKFGADYHDLAREMTKKVNTDVNCRSCYPYFSQKVHMTETSFNMRETQHF